VNGKKMEQVLSVEAEERLVEEFEQVEGARRVSSILAPEAIDTLLAEAERAGGGAEELLAQITKAVLERALQVEMADHLGYEKGDPAGVGSPNSRNGSYGKTVVTASGPVRLQVPRDRAGSFEPRIVPKRAKRLGQVDEMILSLYARGMSTRDIRDHLAEVYGAEISPALVSNVTEVVREEIAEWQNRALDAVYPILYIDAIVVKVRESGSVVNKAAHLVIGVDVDGYKQVLGIWIEQKEGSRFWLNVLTSLRNRGLRDALVVCCDGLTGLPDAIGHVWPEAIVQTCVVHLIRTSMRYVAYADRKKIAAALRPIYTAANVQAAEAALEALRGQFGRSAPGVISAWERSWETFVPFLDFPLELRRVIYTTNAIESMNFQLRKISKTRGHFPDDDAAVKLLYLGIRRIEGRHIDGDGRPVPAGQLRGTGTYGWKRALNDFAIRFPGKLPV
jgi:putative transposase